MMYMCCDVTIAARCCESTYPPGQGNYLEICKGGMVEFAHFACERMLVGDLQFHVKMSEAKV